MEFKHDEAVAFLRAHALMKGIEFPCRGLVCSRGVDNFPLFLYLLAALQRVFAQPHQLVWPIAFLNSLSIFFIFSSICRLYGHRAAWMTTLLYVVSPCAIAFSRKIWAQDLLPFWSTAMFFFAVQILRSRVPKNRAWCGFALGLLATSAGQIHYSALFLCCGYFFFFIYYYRFLRPLPLAALGAGIVMGLLPAIPFFFQDGLSSLPSPTHMPVSPASGLQWHLKDLINFFIRQPIDETLYALLGREYQPFIRAIPGYGSLRYFLSCCVLGGIGRCFWRFVRQGVSRNSRGTGLIAALTAIPLLILGLSRLPLIPAYFIIFYPLPFLFPALLIEHGWRSARRAWGPVAARGFVIILFTIISAYQIIYQGAFLAKIERQGGTSGEYGISYADQARATSWLMELEPREKGYRSLDLAPLAIALNEQTVRPISCFTSSGLHAESQYRMHKNGVPDRIIMINRLAYPELEEHAQPWLLGASRSTYLLNVPAASAEEILKRYPGPKLTPLQRVEEDKIRLLALKMLDTDAR